MHFSNVCVRHAFVIGNLRYPFTHRVASREQLLTWPRTTAAFRSRLSGPIHATARLACQMAADRRRTNPASCARTKGRISVQFSSVQFSPVCGDRVRWYAISTAIFQQKMDSSLGANDNRNSQAILPLAWLIAPRLKICTTPFSPLANP